MSVKCLGPLCHVTTLRVHSRAKDRCQRANMSQREMFTRLLDHLSLACERASICQLAVTQSANYVRMNLY